jgi:hypothetical protein
MKMSLGFFQSAIDRSWKNMHAVCGLPSCPNTLIMRSVAQSQVGLRVGDLWYCSVDCFAGAALTRFSSLSRGRVVEMPYKPRLSIGLVMLSKGFLTDEQLRFAMTESQLRSEELEVSLLRLGLVNERQVTAAKAAQWGYPLLGRERVGLFVEADIPPTLLRNCSAAPLHYSPTTKRLLLGFVNRVEHSLLDALEQVTGYKVEPCFITPTEFKEQSARLTAAPGYEEVFLEDPLTPSQMAKAIGGFAVEIAAKEGCFTRYRNYIWTRLSGKRRKVDVFFRDAIVAEAGRKRNSMLVEEKISFLG